VIVGQLKFVRVAEEVTVDVVFKLDKLCLGLESPDDLPRLAF
jgi:hypothetical protein